MKTLYSKLAIVFVVIGCIGGLIAPTFAYAQAADGQGAYIASPNVLPNCGLLPTDDGSVEGCFVRLAYYGLLYPSAYLARLGGSVFDWFASYTLSSDSYSQAGFVEQGWRVVRDLANIFFIFVLLYIAFRFVLGLEGRDIQKSLANIVLMALVLNFSLFATRIIIDAGNILGRVFYEKIVINNDSDGQNNGYKTLSAGLIAQVKPQVLLSEKVFNSSDTSPQSGVGNEINASDSGTDGIKGSVGFMILVILLVAAVNLVFAWVFFSVGIYFIGRTIGLWFMMILSPIAFVSNILPKNLQEKMKNFSFDSWLSQTFTLSFLIVVFMFFLYLIIMFLQLAFDNVMTTPTNPSTFTLFLSVMIPFIVVIILLIKAKDQAKSMSGQFGQYVGQGLKYMVMGAVGAAGLSVGAAGVAGGVALRQTAGRLGAQMAKGPKKTMLGRAVGKTGKYLSEASFDVRNINIPKPVNKGLGYMRKGLSYATDGNVSAGDFTTQIQGKGSDRNYQKLKMERIKKKENESKIYEGDENDKVRTEDSKYTYIDPVTGNKTTQTVSGEKISVAEAKRRQAEAQANLEREKQRVHDANNYDDKKRDLERKEKDLENKQKEYQELLNKKKAGDRSVTQRDLDIAEINRNSAKTLVDNQKGRIKTIEAMYRDQENEVSKASAVIKAAKNALNKANKQALNNYADSLETWSYAPNPPVNYRGPGDRGAARNVRQRASNISNGGGNPTP